MACVHGHFTIAEYLVQSGAEKNARTFVRTRFMYIFSLTDSHIAAHFHHFQADLTPMHFASDYGHLQIVQLLLKAGADIEAKGGHVSVYVIHLLRCL